MKKRIGVLAVWLFFGLVSPLSAQETEIQYLSGTGYGDEVEWEFFCTEGRNSGEWSAIGVPSCWELQGFGKYQYGVRFYGKETDPAIADEQGKYRYTFEIPEAWRNRRVNIVFDGSMTDTEVRINGRSAGSTHQGAFYRFRYDITDLLKFGGENLLEVTVSKESDNPSVNLAERRADYWNFGGIFRPVFLEALPARHIDRTAIAAEADGSFLAEVYLGQGVAGPLTVSAQITDTAGRPVGDPFSAVVAGGTDKVVLKTQLEEVRLWTAETPDLYQIRFTLQEHEETLHTVSERFGFRSFEVREGDGLYLNGQKITMRGVNRHSFWPESGRTLNRELNYRDVRLMKEMNLNAVRMSHYPPDPEFLDACDELGLYVLNELGGWHGHYDEGVGQQLIRELVTRDVNHPSILFWDNGNEGGWNTALDGEFARWDPQDRPVLHPQQSHSGVETMHYRSYGETQEYLRGEEIYLPTEFLHGLYDGGHGAGLYDYWELMRQHPRCAGGFLWVFADEGVVRTDQDGRIDNQGNYGADGILGPHREKEGSFFTIKEVWSPVQITGPDTLTADFDGTLQVENRYDFTGLSACSFKWALARFPGSGEDGSGHQVIREGELQGPDVAPHASGELELPLPGDWQEADVLYVTALGPGVSTPQGGGDSLWTWSWDLPGLEAPPARTVSGGKTEVQEDEKELRVSAGAFSLHFSRQNGMLTRVEQAGQLISFGQGPRFVAARRGDRTLDGTVDPDADKGTDRIYREIEVEQDLENLTARTEKGEVIVEATYSGPLREVQWRIAPDGGVQLDYEYRYDGVVELMGVCFDYPEEKMQAIRWLGRGPYRSWQNRVHGTRLDVWENRYNDPIPGETYQYPEFKGYFRDWRWAEFATAEGKIRMAAGKPGTYLGVYTPRDGRDALLYTLPETGLAVFDVIPAVRNKVNATDLVGPSSQAQWAGGPKRHRIYFRFGEGR